MVTPWPRLSRRIALLTCIMSLTGACLGMSTAGAVDQGYTFYGGCGIDLGTAPSHLCHKGDPLGVFFQSHSASVAYSVCVTFPAEKPLCATQQEATAGTTYVNKITTGVLGRTEVTWSVNSTPIGSWVFKLLPDPVVARFGVNPLIVSKTHRLFGLLVKHVDEGQRVRAWRHCDGVCPLKLRLVAGDGGTRRYVVVNPPGGAPFSLGETLYVQVDAPEQTDGHGLDLWGRLYTGKLVRDRKGRHDDTAIRRLGPGLCTPPGSDFRQALDCDEVA